MCQGQYGLVIIDAIKNLECYNTGNFLKIIYYI